ncbi:MAG TPA: hypothetical protein VJN22_00510 [Candidatus Eremiobacteraceae bacterium]|nr:hypothetical protein [Candidatus Eremiobacteraceae bacterium]
MSRIARSFVGLGAISILVFGGHAAGRAAAQEPTPIPVQSAPASPYGHVPVTGNRVTFDGTVGGQKTAWAYYSQFWLESYLSVTVDASDFAIQGTQLDDQLGRISNHVITFPNGTHGTVDSIQPYRYRDRLDLEVRVNVTDGALRGKEVWTTAAELVDSAGLPYVKI